MKAFFVGLTLLMVTANSEGSNYLVYQPAHTWQGREVMPLRRASINESQAQGLRQQGYLVEQDQPVFLLQNRFQGNSHFLNADSGGGHEPPVWPMAAMRLQEAHQLPNARGEGVRLCLVDSGVNPQHPALRGAIREARNFTGGAMNDLSDPSGHGTAMATLMAGRDVGPQTVGVAPEASLFVAKVVGSDGTSSVASLAEGFRWCLDRAHVINLSLGYYQNSEIMKDLMAEAARREVTVIAAAGNDPRGVLPSAQAPATIAVGAVNPQGTLASFSGRGSALSFLAPGENVPVYEMDGRVSLKSGTSVSAALTTGVEAIRRSRGTPRLMTRSLPGLESLGVIDAFGTATSR